MPQESAQASYMDTFLGKAAAVDTDGFIDDLQYRPKVIAKTSDYTVKVSESGSFFTTEGATANVNFTLPANSDGPWVFDFFNAEDFNMQVTAETADKMVTFNDDAADSIAFSTSSEKVGGGCRVFSSGGSVCYVQLFTYDTTDQAVTVATA